MSTLLTCYYRPKPGGFCKRLFRAVEALLAEGHTVHYLAVVPFPVEHPNCHFHRYPWPAGHTDGLLFWALFHLIAPPQLLYLGLRHRVDAAFVFGSTYALLMQPLRLLKRIPLTQFLRADVLTNHRLKGRPGWLLRLELLLEGVALHGTRLYGVSRTLTREVVRRHRLLRPRRWGTLANDLGEWKEEVAVSAGAPLRLSCVGVLEARKNPGFALELLEGRGAHELHLSYFGDGPLAAELRAAAERRGVAGRVSFPGWVPAEEIWPRTDLLIFPSLHEGAPNAVLEALANGVPVLASDTPEHREILPPETLLPIDDRAAWSARLSALLEAPERELGALAARQRARARRLCFDWDGRIVRRILFGVRTRHSPHPRTTHSP